jgi:hypothetical protein
VLSPAVVYERRRPEATTLYQVVADNLATLYGAVDDGALGIALPRFVRKEFEFRALAHLTTRDVAEVLERTRRRMTKYLRRRGLLAAGGDGLPSAVSHTG